MDMTIGTFQKWIILAAIGVAFLVILARRNYYLSPMSKLRIECLRRKPERRKNNCVIRLKRRIDERYFLLISLAVYTIISVCGIIENRDMIVGIVGEHLVLGSLAVAMIWMLLAVTATCAMCVMMEYWQEEKYLSLKKQYEPIIIVNIKKEHENDYHDYVERRNELSEL